MITDDLVRFNKSIEPFGIMFHVFIECGFYFSCLKYVQTSGFLPFVQFKLEICIGRQKDEGISLAYSTFTLNPFFLGFWF